MFLRLAGLFVAATFYGVADAGVMYESSPQNWDLLEQGVKPVIAPLEHPADPKRIGLQMSGGLFFYPLLEERGAGRWASVTETSELEGLRFFGATPVAATGKIAIASRLSFEVNRDGGVRVTGGTSSAGGCALHLSEVQGAVSIGLNRQCHEDDEAAWAEWSVHTESAECSPDAPTPQRVYIRERVMLAGQPVSDSQRLLGSIANCSGTVAASISVNGIGFDTIATRGLSALLIANFRWQVAGVREEWSNGFSCYCLVTDEGFDRFRAPRSQAGLSAATNLFLAGPYLVEHFGREVHVMDRSRPAMGWRRFGEPLEELPGALIGLYMPRGFDPLNPAAD